MARIDSVEDIRRLVRQERERRGLTQATAAGLIGHTQKWLSDFERGKSDPPASMVFNVARLLGIVLDATAFEETGLTLDEDVEHDVDEGL